MRNLNKCSIPILISNQITEAENVLRYTLQLPLKNINVPEMPDIPSDNSNSWEASNISKNLNDYFNIIGESIYDEFGFLFNYHDGNVFGCKTDNTSNLSILSSKYFFWKHIFKQDMIFSLFIKLRNLLTSKIYLTPYKFFKLANYTLSNDELALSANQKCHGFDYLMEYTDQNQSVTIKNNISPLIDTAEISPQSSNVQKGVLIKLRKLQPYFNLKNLLPFYPHTDISADLNPLLCLSMIEFSQFLLCPKRKGIINFNIYPIINSHKEGTSFTLSRYEKYVQSISHLLSQIRIESIDQYINYERDDNIPKHCLSLSDKLYLRYQIEKLFAPVMIDCMYRNIKRTENTSNALDDQATINILSCCFNLPNVFTRQYLFQMAVDTLIYQTDTGFADSYFFTKYITEPTAIMLKARNRVDPLRLHDTLNTWIDRFKSFTNYLSHMLLPIYENLYFVTIWNSIRSRYPNKNETECIIHLYKLITQYLNNEDYVHILFSTEKTFWQITKDSYQSQDKSNLKPEHILKPNFIADNSINCRLYHKCILSHCIAAKQTSAPEFLTLQYLNQYASNPMEHIDSFYIRSFISGI